MYRSSTGPSCLPELFEIHRFSPSPLYCSPGPQYFSAEFLQLLTTGMPQAISLPICPPHWYGFKRTLGSVATRPPHSHMHFLLTDRGHALWPGPRSWPEPHLVRSPATPLSHLFPCTSKMLSHISALPSGHVSFPTVCSWKPPMHVPCNLNRAPSENVPVALPSPPRALVLPVDSVLHFGCAHHSVSSGGQGRCHLSLVSTAQHRTWHTEITE